MRLRGEVRREVQQARYHVAVEQDPRLKQRRVGKDEQQASDEEERQVLQVVHLDTPDALDALVGQQLLGIRAGVERCLAQILQRAVAAFLPRHPRDGEPVHRHRLENHDRGGDDIGREDRILQAKSIQGSFPQLPPHQRHHLLCDAFHFLDSVLQRHARHLRME